ncbi:Na/Pi cotransporter family protein [Pelagibacterium xiamenense]|uniref:Na/Pi cotransporter family protein n=1 Tax=Pelagibacterium xiamenense TaxID=2901140 RepID=UPI001E37BAA1|nr:Na/Pi cotransporter family protein [Pelagibacterium xiamenense]
MNLYSVAFHLAGAVMLLLWAVRMVRTGVERSHAPALRSLLRESRGGRMRAAGIGAGIAVVLQSSTAVALLAAGFAGSGVLSLATGLTLMLGADLGSSLVVQILSIDLQWLVPLLLIAGGTAFFKGQTRTWRQGGRILIGIALILVSLQMIGVATAPLRETGTVVSGVLGYLAADFVTAFLIGAAFTWLVHSSVASILMIAAFAGQGILPLEVGVSLVLGANLGGGLIALTLTRSSVIEARRIAAGNLLFRGAGAVVVLLGFHLLRPSIDWLGVSEATRLINLHLGFNFALLILCLPLTGLVAKLMERIIVSSDGAPEPLEEPGSRLDPSVIDQPPLALASAKRELLRMAEIIERMLAPLMELYETGDPEKIKQVKRLEQAVDTAQSEIKLYLAKINYPDDLDDDARRAQELANFAINLEYVGDAIAKTLMTLAETRRDQNLKFSPAGWRELNELHHRVMQNMQLALNVLMSEDRESARLLLEEKEEMSRAERASATGHLQRLRDGAHRSIETSNIHLETVRALKTINSLFASVAYPILAESGELRDTRLA